MNDREFHSVLESEFASFLRERGYPDGSLIYEPRLKGPDGKMYSPDFLIVDPVRNERLAIVEVKGRLNLRIQQAKAQLEAYRSAAGDSSLPAFLVTPTEETNAKRSFQLHIFNDEDELEELDSDLFPAFSALSSNFIAEKKQDLKQKKDQISEKFQAISHITAGLLFLLLIADFICSQRGVELLTAERLTMLGAVVALIVIPFAQRFKGLGIEWERSEEKSGRR